MRPYRKDPYRALWALNQNPTYARRFGAPFWGKSCMYFQTCGKLIKHVVFLKVIVKREGSSPMRWDSRWFLTLGGHSWNLFHQSPTVIKLLVGPKNTKWSTGNIKFLSPKREHHYFGLRGRTLLVPSWWCKHEVGNLKLIKSLIAACIPVGQGPGSIGLANISA